MSFSIRTNALLLVLLPTLLVGLAVSVLLTGQRFDDIEAELDARGEREAAYLADASQLALLVGDSQSLAHLARVNTRGSGAAVAVVFVDAANEVIAASGDDREVHLALACGTRGCEGNEGRMVYSAPIVAGDDAVSDSAFSAYDESHTPTELGHVLLSFTTNSLQAEQQRFLGDALFITGGVMLVAVFLSLRFSRRLTLPIQNLSQVVARIRGGDLSARVKPLATGELQALEFGINEMADRIAESTADWNRRVDEATADVSAAKLDLEKRYAELDAALQREAEASRAKDEFLARMSHELRTPLASVRACAEVVVESPDPEIRADHQRAMTVAVEMLLKIIDSVLEFKRLESDEIRFEETSFNLHTSIRNMKRMMQPLANEKYISLECHIDESVPAVVRGDRHRLDQVLGNLLSNAVKFTERGGVTLSLTSHGVHDYCIEVRDTGIGICGEQQGRLFDPFAQADESTRRRFGGSGLGLAIADRLVCGMKGRIELDSAEGAGTRVRVLLPMLPGDAEFADEELELIPEQGGVNLSVLVVEDHKMNRDLIAHALGTMGAEVFRAEDGPAALACLASESIDLVFSDVHMPGMNGVDLAERIRARWPHIPVYALTANVIRNEEIQLNEAGVLGTLYKPWNKKEMLEILQIWSRPESMQVKVREESGASLDQLVPELRRLLTDLESGMEGGAEHGDIADAAHELLGVVKMFCSGAIVASCRRAEVAIREQGFDRARQYLQRLELQIGQLVV